MLFLVLASCFSNLLRSQIKGMNDIVGISYTNTTSQLIPDAILPVALTNDCNAVQEIQNIELGDVVFYCRDNSTTRLDFSFINSFRIPNYSVSSVGNLKAAVSSAGRCENIFLFDIVEDKIVGSREDSNCDSLDTSFQIASSLIQIDQNNWKLYTINSEFDADIIKMYDISNDGSDDEKVISIPKIINDIDLLFGSNPAFSQIEYMEMFENKGILVISGITVNNKIFISSFKRNNGDPNKFERINVFFKDFPDEDDRAYERTSIARLDDTIIFFYTGLGIDIDGSRGVRAEVYKVNDSGLFRVTNEIVVSELISGDQGFIREKGSGLTSVEVIDRDEKIFGFIYNDRGNLVIMLMRLLDDDTLERLGDTALLVGEIGEVNSHYDINVKKEDENTLDLTIIYNVDSTREMFEKEFKINIERATTSSTSSNTVAITPKTTVQPLVIINSNDGASLEEIVGSVAGGVAVVLGGVLAIYTKCCGLFGRSGKVGGENQTIVNPAFININEEHRGSKLELRMDSRINDGWSELYDTGDNVVILSSVQKSETELDQVVYE